MPSSRLDSRFRLVEAKRCCSAVVAEGVSRNRIRKVFKTPTIGEVVERIVVGEDILIWKSWLTDSETESSKTVRYFLVTLCLLQPRAAAKEIVTSRRFLCESVLPHLSVRECDGVVLWREIELAGQIRLNADLYSSHKHLYFAQLQDYDSEHRPAVHQYGVCQGTERKRKKTHRKDDGGMGQMWLSLRGKDFKNISLALFC